MSARALQRVVVRMHHDPAFAARVLADPRAALAGVDVTPEERDMLLRPDPRAWRSDPGRTDRLLEALRREYVVACALAEVASGRAPLLAFFRSPAFHDAVQERRLLVEAFGRWLRDAASRGRIGKRPTAEVAALELAATAVRRAPSAPPEGPLRVRAPWVRVERVRGGTLDLYQAVFERLRATGAVPRARARLRRDEEFVCVERLPTSEVVFGILPPALARMLESASEPRSPQELASAAVSLGADPAEATDIVAGLERDRLIVPAAG